MSSPPVQTSVTRRLTIVLAVALVLRLIVLAGTFALEPHVVDERQYLDLATSLVEGRGFASPAGPTSMRPPLFPGLVAATWTVTGTRSLLPVRLVHVVVAVLTSLVVFGLARDLFGDEAGIAAAACAAFYPSLLIADYLILTEVLFAFLVACAAWALVRALQRGSAAAAALSGVVLGLAALTRSVLYPFPFVAVVVVLAGMRESLPRRLGSALLLLVAWGAVLGPWAARNTRLQGVPVLVDTMGGLNLMMGNYEHTPIDRMWDAISKEGAEGWAAALPAAPPGGGSWTEGKKERWARQQAVEYMQEHPGQTLWRSLVKAGDFWALERDFIAGVQQGLYHPPPWLTVVIAACITLSYPAVLFLAVLGAGRLRPRDGIAPFVPLVLVLFVAVMHSIVFGHPRYRLPLMPLLCVYAGSAIAARAWRRHAWPGGVPVVPTIAAAAFVAMWIAQFVWRDWSFAERLLGALWT